MDSALRNALDNAEQFQTSAPWHGGGQLMIYGTGPFARDTVRVLQNAGVEIAGFIDHLAIQGGMLNELPVYRPEAVAGREIGILLSIHNREANILEIKKNLQNHGFKNILSAIDLYDHMAENLGTRYWLTKRTYYANHISEIEQAYELLTDEISQRTFSSLLGCRITGDYSFLPVPDREHQYFPPDLPAWQRPLRMIDCGAFDGDGIRSFLEAGFNIEALAAFEPDPENFLRLAEFIKTRRTNIPEIGLWPCGVYSITAQLHFQSGQGEASAFSEKGDMVTPCIALDDILPNFAPNLIKMDIEGAELAALQGARELIISSKPGLAISVYHTPAHLWEIPIYISHFAEKNNIHYTYHLRAHANNCFDTVFYAIPIGYPI